MRQEPVDITFMAQVERVAVRFETRNATLKLIRKTDVLIDHDLFPIWE
jgi:hypothetical protein